MVARVPPGLLNAEPMAPTRTVSGESPKPRIFIVSSPVECSSSFRLTFVRYFDIIGHMKTEDAVKALGALAQEWRLSVFRLLVRKGPAGMAAGDLSDRFGLPPATMSFHLKELVNAGLIASRRESRSIIYSANYTNMQTLMKFLLENCCADEGGNC
jgi:ArsR family transcriptional regulator, arsenate/arsenite/antimonite-responsive transcriptional repressor